jgi:hypothetical protein
MLSKSRMFLALVAAEVAIAATALSAEVKQIGTAAPAEGIGEQDRALLCDMLTVNLPPAVRGEILKVLTAEVPKAADDLRFLGFVANEIPAAAELLTQQLQALAGNPLGEQRRDEVLELLRMNLPPSVRKCVLDLVAAEVPRLAAEQAAPPEEPAPPAE